jgi:hypothetical protein
LRQPETAQRPRKGAKPISWLIRVIHSFRKPPGVQYRLSAALLRMTTVRLSRDLAEQGYSYAEMARMARNAELVRIRLGAYGPRPEPALDPRFAHRQLLEGTLGQSSGSRPTASPMVRWVWAELYTPAPLIERLHRAFACGLRTA